MASPAIVAEAMVDLLAQYERHGLQLDSRELPDHLPLYLEYTGSVAVYRSDWRLAGYCAILALLQARLQQRKALTPRCSPRC